MTHCPPEAEIKELKKRAPSPREVKVAVKKMKLFPLGY
jgi:hypothetical protein